MKIIYNCISGVMVSMLIVNVGSSPGEVKPKTIKQVFVASLLRIHHLGARAKNGWL
jgi:hypothetical protein